MMVLCIKLWFVKKMMEILWGKKMLSKNERKLLIELICNEQTHMIVKDHTKYESEKYHEKVKIKDM